ncbi:MAG: HAD-IA family hydrolase [Flavobacterium sp.]|nr:HAD-IA family hydrolase [Aeromicrobium sp.]
MATLSAVIFDVDGTLVDSERDGHRVAFNQAFADFGLPDHWGVDVYGRLLTVTGGRQRLRAHLESRGYAGEQAAGLAIELHKAKTRIFTRMVHEGAIQLRPGVRQLVESLHDDGVRLFVATTGSRDWVEPLVTHHFGTGVFELLVTGTEVHALKPEPQVYLTVMREAGLQPAGVVAVEDSENGLRAAQAAQLPCLVVTNPYTENDDLSAADAVLDSFGPTAHQISGKPVPLVEGAVTEASLRALADCPERRADHAVHPAPAVESGVYVGTTEGREDCPLPHASARSTVREIEVGGPCPS